MWTHLLLPALQFLNQEIVSFGDFAELGVHATLEIDQVLPSLQSIPGILIPFTHDFIKVSHRYLGHKWLLNGTAKDGFDPCVSTLS